MYARRSRKAGAAAFVLILVALTLQISLFIMKVLYG